MAVPAGDRSTKNPLYRMGVAARLVYVREVRSRSRREVASTPETSCVPILALKHTQQ